MPTKDKGTTALAKKQDSAISKQLSETPINIILSQLIGSQNTGVKTVADGMLMLMKAKELGIGFGNAIPHMHVVNGKPGIDIHIVKGILSKPSAFVTWKLTKNYEAVYSLITQDSELINSNDDLGEYTLKIVPFSKLKTATGKDNEIVASHIIVKGKKTIIDRETEYFFTRQKKDIEGNVILTTSVGYFSEAMMRAANLHKNRDGFESPETPWFKYRQLMIATRAFTYGARDIASDLLMGNYETTELFDMMNIEYTSVEVDGEIIAKPIEE